MTPGYKTTEFWLTFLYTLAATFIASGFVGDGNLAMKIAVFVTGALASLGYGAQRAAVKKAVIALPTPAPPPPKVDL